MAAKWFSFAVGLGLLGLGLAALYGTSFQGSTVVAVSVVLGILGLKIGLPDTSS